MALKDLKKNHNYSFVINIKTSYLKLQNIIFLMTWTQKDVVHFHLLYYLKQMYSGIMLPVVLVVLAVPTSPVEKTVTVFESKSHLYVKKEKKRKAHT